MTEWFAGVVDDLATEAVRGLRVDVVPPVLARPLAPLDAAARFTYPIRDAVDQHLRLLRHREANTAMALWGIHL